MRILKLISAAYNTPANWLDTPEGVLRHEAQQDIRASPTVTVPYLFPSLLTYIWTGKCRAYLTVVLDLLSRKPEGWAMSTSPDSALTVKVMQMAWELRGRPAGEGSHYTSRQYRQALWRCQIKQSMSRRGNYWELQRNAKRLNPIYHGLSQRRAASLVQRRLDAK